MIVIAGSVEIRPELREVAVERGLWMSRLSEAEPGCRRYRFSSDLADPNRFDLFEEWADEEALRAHFETAHMAEFGQILPTLLASAPAITRYEVTASRPL